MTKNRILLLATVICLVTLLCVTMISCSKGGKDPKPSESTGETGSVSKEPVQYALQLVTEGGKVLEGVGVYFYTDWTCQELVWFCKTDANGVATFTDVPSDCYVAVLDKVPQGYAVEEFYALTGLTTEVVLSTAMGDGALAEVTYELGAVMHNFSVTDPDGKVYVLSELLEEYDAVMLNFWYLQCDPCRSEFPYLQQSYEEFSDKVAVIAMNPLNPDAEEIAQYRKTEGLTFPMVPCEQAWESAMQIKAYPTTVVVDRYGTIGLIHEGAITEKETFDNIFKFFTAEDYEQTTVENLEDLEEEQPGSSEENPIEIGGKTSFQITVEPGKLVYCHLYRLDGMYLQIKNDAAYAVYNNRTYEPSGGVLGFTVRCADTYTPAKVVFGNSSEEEQTYNVTLSAAPGSYMNPYKLELDKEFTTKSAAGNDQGVYYTYRATEDGTLTVQCLSVTSGVRFNYVLYNQSTGRMNTLQEDGNVSTGTITVPVKSGNKVQITICVLPNESNAYPAATFTTKAYLGEPEEEQYTGVEKINYAITVTDADRKPMEGVSLVMTVDGKPVNLVTDEKGVAATKQEPGNYPVIVKLPEGYRAATTEFRVSKAYPFVSIKLEAYVTEMADYQVKVLDQDGNPVKNAMVTIGSSFLYTDAEGIATFTLPVGTYSVQIVVDGETIQADFADGEKELAVTLSGSGQGDSGGETEKLSYTVTVVDYAGKPQEGVAVQIMKEGVPVATAASDSEGVAAFQLEAADYTVVLAFSESGKYYDRNRAVLPKGTLSLTVKVAPGVGTEYLDAYYDSDAYYVVAGGTYVQMQDNLVNYYLFEPTEAGTYRITTTDPAARVSYWGGNINFVYDATSGTDYSEETNSYTLNVKEAYLGSTYIIGITGAPSCILEIVRIDDAVLDETDIPYTPYVGTPPTKAFKLTIPAGKKLTYVKIDAETSDYQLVRGSDGYYHLGSATGPVMYMNLGQKAPYIALSDVIGATGDGGQNFCKFFYDDAGNLTLKENYNTCLIEYYNCADKTYGVYPLTDDLIYMMKNGGEHIGWWNIDHANCLFKDDEGNGTVAFNEEIAWMLTCCYLQ